MADAAGAGRGAGADLADACPGADSGNVSQSHSSASGLGEPEDEDAWEASLSATAAAYSAYLLADRSLFSEQVRGAAAPRRRGGRSPSRPVPSLRLGLPSSPGSGRERRAFRGCPADGARGRRPFPVRAVPLRRLHGLGGEGGEFRAGGGAAGVSSRLRLTWAGDGKAAGFLRSWR